MNESVKYYLPLNLIKGKDKSGNEIMKMRGVASTSSTDSDGENLKPEGFKLDYFLKSGYINWNHQTNKDPLSIIGRPTKAEINKSNELEIEFNLFSSSKKAAQVWELQKALQKEGLGLGLSIEGKVLKRNEKNKKVVEKALLTGCAVTPNPKNNNTTLSIIKANNFEFLEDIFVKDDKEDIDKALEAGHLQGGDMDNQTDSSSLKKESLEGEDDKKKKEKKKTMKKSEVISYLNDEYPDLDNKSIDGLYKLIVHSQKQINMSQLENNKEVTKEAISKALASLGLDEGQNDSQGGTQNDDTVQKGNSAPDTSKEVTSDADNDKAVLEKALEILEKGGYTKSDDSPKEDDEDKDDKKKGMKKSEDEPDLLKSIENLFSEKATKDGEKFTAMATLIKGVMQDNTDLKQKVESLEGQSVGRRSVTSNGYIQKSQGDGDLDGDAKSLSVSANKHQILDQIEKSMSKDDWNGDLGRSVSNFEISGNVDNVLLKKAEELGLNLTN